jgi:hypothetical protein
MLPVADSFIPITANDMNNDGHQDDALLYFDQFNGIGLVDFELVEGNSLYNITLGDVEEEEEEEEFNGPETVTLTLSSEADGTDDGVFNPTPFTLTFTVDTAANDNSPLFSLHANDNFECLKGADAAPQRAAA